MLNRKGFTLIELMVVILIVAILAAVAIPIMRGRIDSAKWSEGKAMMGTIATAIRAYVAERGEPLANLDDFADLTDDAVLIKLGFIAGDLDGTYFAVDNFSIPSGSYIDNDLQFLISASAPTGITSPSNVTLDQNGIWVETP